MDFEFDKEIDFLLRQTAQQGEAAFANENAKFKIQNPKFRHLDADELSAFAENALPEKAKQQYLLHLADCGECRKSLSGLIALNGESSEETVSVEERRFAPTTVPWYRKSFAIPNLVYAMGALVVLFSGIAVWTVLQSVNDSQSPTVSQTYDKQTGGGKGMSSDGDATVGESYSSNSAAVSNMTTMANTAAVNSNSMTASSSSAANAAAMPGAPYSTANSNAAAVAPAERDKAAKIETAPTALPLKESRDSAKAETSDAASGASVAPPPPVREKEDSSDDEFAGQQSEAQNTIAQTQNQIMPDSRNVKRAPAPTTRPENKKRAEEARSGEAEKSKNATATAGGKTFRREENVWYDTAYRGQPTVNVARGTGEYKKLDAGLRGIAENLGGTIVVVWKQKTYRIQ